MNMTNTLLILSFIKYSAMQACYRIDWRFVTLKKSLIQVPPHLGEEITPKACRVASLATGTHLYDKHLEHYTMLMQNIEYYILWFK
jgi:hypothetical protein